MSATQVVPEPILELERILGGAARRTPATAGRASYFEWRAVGRASEIAAGLILPYLRPKRRQAELLIAWFETVGLRGARLTPEVLTRRAEIRMDLAREKARRS